MRAPRTLRGMLMLSAILALGGCGPTASHHNEVAAPATVLEPAMPTQTLSQQQSQPAAAAERVTLLAEIKALVGSAAATEPAQCKKIGFGHKACGGPASYLIYSTQGLDEALLLQKVARYNQLDQAEQERQGMMSDCAVVPEPGVALVGGFCVASGNADAF